jgi:hypothetical protein
MPYALNPKPYTPKIKPQTLNPERRGDVDELGAVHAGAYGSFRGPLQVILIPKPCLKIYTLNPKPYTLNPYPKP